jgi:hypothetical protein
MSWDPNDISLDVLQNIEQGLVAVYRSDAGLTDGRVMLSLGKAKAAIKQRFGYGKGLDVRPDSPAEAAIIERMVAIGMERIGTGTGEAMTLDAYVKCLDKVARSVDTHRAYGIRGYYEFIKDYVG